MKTSWRKRWAALPCIAVAVALAATGCSSDDNDSGSSSVDESVLGTPNKATGAPVTILLPTAGPKAATHTQEIEAANAAVSYLNEYRGGINGHPIQLEVCEDQLQVSLARECANKAVASGAVAVVAGDPSNPDAITNVTSPAGLSFLVNTGGGQPTLSLPNTHVLSNSIAGLLGIPAYYAQKKDIKKVAILAIDAPIATGPLKALGPLVFGNAGAQMDLITVPPGTADMTPQVQAALKNGDGAFHILGDVPFCTSALKAMQTLNADKPVTTVSQCVGTPEDAKQLPGGYAGITMSVSHDLDPAAEDTKIFEAALEKYDATGAEDGVSAYMSVLAFQRALDGMPGEVNRKTVAARLNAMPEPVKTPLYGDASFQCGTKPISIAPNICQASALAGELKEDGTISNTETLDLAPLFKMPSA
ncbi:ABC transporter substrate-binding protein [Gordonia sp. CPCC 206044]|uniref:ABC transporter substrate-binding protein n=1 Tax=Gordonia sp. CPCC 206044 TaxID=3140793 RepID=UPI003AF40088